MQVRLLVFLPLLALIGCKSMGDGIKLEFTEAEIQEKIGKKFPKTEKIYDIIPVVIDEPKVHFIEGDKRIEVSLSARVEIPFKDDFEASLTFISGITFDNEKKSLNLTDFEVKKIAATKLPEKYKPALEILSTLLAQKYLEDQEVYRLKDTSLEKKAAKYLIQDVQVADQMLIIKLGL